MKKLLFLSLFAIVAILSACSSDDDGPQRVEEKTFTGTLEIGSVQQENVSFHVSFNYSAGLAKVTMLNVSFAQGMPQMDIVVPDIRFTVENEGHLNISDRDKVPYVNEMPVDRYKFTYIAGTVSAGVRGIYFYAELANGMTIDFDGVVAETAPEAPETPEEDDEIENGSSVKSFTGELLVGDYSENDKLVQMRVLSGNVLTINMSGVKFAATMPVSLNITIPSIPYVCQENGDISFSGTNIVPLIGTVESPAYRFATVNGSYDCDTRTLDLYATMAEGEGIPSHVAGFSFQYFGIE